MLKEFVRKGHASQEDNMRIFRQLTYFNYVRQWLASSEEEEKGYDDLGGRRWRQKAQRSRGWRRCKHSCDVGQSSL